MSPNPYTKEPVEKEMVIVCGWLGMQAPAKMSPEDWVREKGMDPVIAQIIHLYQEKQLFKSRINPDDFSALKVILRHRWQFVL